MVSKKTQVQYIATTWCLQLSVTPTPGDPTSSHRHICRQNSNAHKIQTNYLKRKKSKIHQEIKLPKESHTGRREKLKPGVSQRSGICHQKKETDLLIQCPSLQEKTGTRIMRGQQWPNMPLISSLRRLRGRQISVSSKTAWSTNGSPGQPGLVALKNSVLKNR